MYSLFYDFGKTVKLRFRLNTLGVANSDNPPMVRKMMLHFYLLHGYRLLCNILIRVNIGVS